MGNPRILVAAAYLSCLLTLGFFAFVGWWIFGADIKAWCHRRIATIANWLDRFIDYVLFKIMGDEDDERNLP